MAAKQSKVPENLATAKTGDMAQAEAGADESSLRRTLELVFYVHMEQASLADEVLVQYGLGRPHHRILHFAVSRPGITVNELLSILRITNQAFSRTLNQLTKMGLMEQRPGLTDRRLRCNYATAKGVQLHRRLIKRQFEHIERSLRGVPQKDMETFWSVLYHMVREQDKTWITDYKPA